MLFECILKTLTSLLFGLILRHKNDFFEFDQLMK
jgi:hypothetical protein